MICVLFPGLLVLHNFYYLSALTLLQLKYKHLLVFPYLFINVLLARIYLVKKEGEYFHLHPTY
jgi:hypothetical protein